MAWGGAKKSPKRKGGAWRRRAMPWGKSTAGHQGGHGPLCEDHEDQVGSQEQGTCKDCTPYMVPP